MILTEKEYTELTKDFNSLIENLDEKHKREATEQVRKLELKYWEYVEKPSFSQHLRKAGDLDKVLWLLEAIQDSKKELKKMQQGSNFYDDLLKDVRYWQQELFGYWKSYVHDGSVSDFSKELKKPKWIFLKYINYMRVYIINLME